MSTASIEFREKKKGKHSYDPVRRKFDDEYKDFDNVQLLKEHLYQMKNQSELLEKTSKDVALIKWIVVIAFVASIIIGVLLGLTL
tara:strand:+ start:227 stop:481 length:255 start_codon:yes stop_codon:yes gene_type:complete